MDYVRMSPITSGGKVGDRRPLGYSLKTLLCSVAPYIRAQPALDPKEASDQLILVDTTESGITLGRILPHSTVKTPASQREQTFSKSTWTKRPFQYSSAIHPTAAGIVVDLLLDLILCRRREPSDTSKRIRVLDPTCGSGTFLAYFLALEDIDVCVEG
jgi:hypothetical protein